MIRLVLEKFFAVDMTGVGSQEVVLFVSNSNINSLEMKVILQSFIDYGLPRWWLAQFICYMNSKENTFKGQMLILSEYFRTLLLFYRFQLSQYGIYNKIAKLVWT